jgi:flagellar protein FlaG
MANDLSVVRSPAAPSYDAALAPRQHVRLGADGLVSSAAQEVEAPREPSANVRARVEEAREPAGYKELEETLAQMNKAVQRLEPHLEFSFSTEDNRLVVKLVDGIKNEVLRQMPPEHMLKLSRRLDDLRGLLLNEIG